MSKRTPDVTLLAIILGLYLVVQMPVTVIVLTMSVVALVMATLVTIATAQVIRHDEREKVDR